MIDGREKVFGLLEVSLTANFLLEEIKDRYAEILQQLKSTRIATNVGENMSFFGFFRPKFFS